MMHPVASEMIRSYDYKAPTHDVAEKIALTRRAQDGRAITNWSKLAPILVDRGFETIDIASLDFNAQVRTFFRSKAVFSTLGSGLTGLIFSPPGVRVTSVAPNSFGDSFFYALVVDRRGKYANIRGGGVRTDPLIPNRSGFKIASRKLEEGLDALGC